MLYEEGVSVADARAVWDGIGLASLGRLLYGCHRGRGGRQYEYFCCNNRAVRRRKTKCSSSHASVPTVDERIQEHYRSVRIAPEVQEQIRAELRDELRDRSTLIEREAERHQRALKAIEAKQEKLVQLYYDDRVTADVFDRQQDKLKDERRAAKRLQDTATTELEDIQQALDLALSRVNKPYEVYAEGTELERRMMNRAIFAHIKIGDDAEITGATLTPVYAALSAWQPGLGQPAASQPQSQSRLGKGDFQPTAAPVHRWTRSAASSTMRVVPTRWSTSRRLPPSTEVPSKSASVRCRTG
ncbi:MAG: hypothetical protein H0X28_12285 [Solirubrobacterales bacterium]|nr:hypothetical protein [Solirubrobacterales bacterium]